MKRDAFPPGAIGELTFGSICSGIEAASVAWGPLGWRAAWLAEIDPFACAVLAHHYPHVPNLGDMTTIARRVLTGEVPAPDILCGGTPCQAFSVAGLRESLADVRGNLTLKFVELADAIDHVRGRAGLPPASVFWENVPGVLSTKDNAFGCFLAGLAGEDEPLQPPGGRWSNAGCVYGPTRAIAWRTLDAQYFGLAQRRRRVFVVASARNGFDPAQVLFEWEGLRRDTAPRREAGQDPAPCVTAGAANGSAAHGARSGSAKDNLITPVAATLTASFGRLLGQSGQDADHGHSHLIPETAHTLRGEGFDASEDGTGRGTPLVPVAFDTTQITSQANRSNPRPGDPCHPLAAGAHPPAIAFPARLSGTQYASTANIAPSMGAANPTAVAYTTKLHNTGSNNAGKIFEERTTCLDANSPPPALLMAHQVRRLTPVECERLQGFPDGYTDIPWRTYQEAQRKSISYETLLAQRGMTLRGPSVEECPDGPRYKSLGNSWAIDVVEWIGQRLQQHLARL